MVCMKLQGPSWIANKQASKQLLCSGIPVPCLVVTASDQPAEEEFSSQHQPLVV